jgi:hypothetical protein
MSLRLHTFLRKNYDGDTIVVAQPMRQRQATVTSSPIQKQIQHLPSPTITARGTPDPRETPHPYDSLDPVEQELFQESFAFRASQHTTPRGWNFDETPNEDAHTHQLYVPDRR